LIDWILPLVPGLTDELEKGITVLDLGCGSGRAINLMAQTFPESQFVGYDLSEEGIQRGIAEAEQLGLSNVRYEVKDVTALDHGEQFDLITAFDAIHDQAQPAKVLRGIANALRQDGTFLMQDIAASSYLYHNLDHPIGPFLYTISCLHCMTVSLAANGAGLGTVWGEEKALEMLREAGFLKMEVKRLPHDFQNNYYINKKG
jgi:2-polyprenyl-3-methyl-5-hydroxy-6-metoxy-1,4-benzoquinol methylase